MFAWFTALIWPPAPAPAPHVHPPAAPVQRAPYYNGDFAGYALCEQIARPALHQLISAALEWDRIAKTATRPIRYVFTGRFVARLLSRQDFVVQEIEILLQPDLREDNGAVLRDLFDTNTDSLGVDDAVPAHHLILVDTTNPDRRKGIAIRASCLGTDGYPDAFVPYLFHPLGLAEPEATPTEHRLNLASIHPFLSGNIPVLRAHLILQQRLLHFDFNAHDESQNVREFPEVQALLRYVAQERPMPQFPPESRPSLSEKVRAWIKYADIRGVPTSHVDVATWRRLGLDIQDEYVSRVFRMNYPPYP
jgi:hypothetical protein